MSHDQTWPDRGDTKWIVNPATGRKTTATRPDCRTCGTTFSQARGPSGTRLPTAHAGLDECVRCNNRRHRIASNRCRRERARAAGHIRPRPRPRGPRAGTDALLTRWHSLVTRVNSRHAHAMGTAWTMRELAAELRVSVHALEQALYRARRRGDERAIYHTPDGAAAGGWGHRRARRSA